MLSNIKKSLIIKKVVVMVFIFHGQLNTFVWYLKLFLKNTLDITII